MVGTGTMTPVGPVVVSTTYWTPILCQTRYATADQYAAFWCAGSILRGVDNSGGVANLFLTDSTVNFINFGVEADTGMRLYNLTDGTYGPITSVTAHTLTATGVSWNDGNQYEVVTITTEQRSQIELYLEITASDIHAALGSIGACGCTPSVWGLDYLAKLNIIEAGLYHKCPCASPDLTDVQRRLFADLIESRLRELREGEIEICEGETGSLFPAADYAQMSLTEWNYAQIVKNARTVALTTGEEVTTAVTTDAGLVTLSNGGAVAMTAGQPVYVIGADQVALAKADAAATARAIGLVEAGEYIAAGASGSIRTDGIIELTTVQWDALTGGAGGLSPGAIYYVSNSVAGGLLAAPPVIVGHYVVKVGNAISTTRMEIEIEPPILI